MKKEKKYKVTTENKTNHGFQSNYRHAAKKGKKKGDEVQKHACVLGKHVTFDLLCAA
jgi:hypothetical protein